MTQDSTPFSQRLKATAAQLQDIPEPDPEARQYSEQLQSLICQEIQNQGGKIPFHRFMELALYAPGLGYYSAGSHKLGEGGDFVTAPEISPLFSHCVANAIQPVLSASPLAGILEVGAGTGVMAAAILNHLAELDCLPDQYLILEVSADLRERQRVTLTERAPNYIDHVQWLDVLPTEFNGVVLANELLDAMPVHRFHVQDDNVYGQYVTWQDESFSYIYGEFSEPRLVQRITDIEQAVGNKLEEGYLSEINLAAEDWVRSVGNSLQSGLILLIDYGFPRREFYHPQRHAGTLMCHYRHRAHDDPFLLVGLQDITAHVDFTAIADAALSAGLDVAGYTTQAHFLFGSGLAEMGSQLQTHEIEQQLIIANQIKKLTLPHEMGELFKVMGLTKGLQISLPAFGLYDMRGHL